MLLANYHAVPKLMFSKVLPVPTALSPRLEYNSITVQSLTITALSPGFDCNSITVQRLDKTVLSSWLEYSSI